jgi:hypothetical protein
MGTTKGTSQAYNAKYGYSSRIHGMGTGASVVRQASRKGINEITYTKTFEVQHGDNDEVELIHIDQSGTKGQKPKSDNSSEVSL